jgi:hypothetical protein
VQDRTGISGKRRRRSHAGQCESVSCDRPENRTLRADRTLRRGGYWRVWRSLDRRGIPRRDRRRTRGTACARLRAGGGRTPHDPHLAGATRCPLPRRSVDGLRG